MKKQRILRIVILVTLLSMPARAGWISDFGKRLTEGARNAVQNNLQNKLNQKINDTLDGKLNTDSAKGKRDYKMNSQISKNKSGSEVEYEKIDSSGMLDLSVVKRRALPVTGKYQEIDLGTFKFQGERLYGETLHMNKQRIWIFICFQVHI